MSSVHECVTFKNTLSHHSHLIFLMPNYYSIPKLSEDKRTILSNNIPAG